MAIPNRTDLPPTAQAHVEVQITPVIAADFDRRQVFPELRRTADAVERIGYSRVYRVAIDLAEKVLEDAQARRADRALQRGVPKAYTSLIERLEDAIRQAKGIWFDPGMEEARRRQDCELARFNVGEKVRLWRSASDDDNGEVVTVSEGFGMHRVADSKGEYVRKDGSRGSYRPGYCARGSDGKSFFYAAGDLQTMDYKPGHLRLVHSRP